jgi:hypothetical protein
MNLDRITKEKNKVRKELGMSLYGPTVNRCLKCGEVVHDWREKLKNNETMIHDGC